MIWSGKREYILLEVGDLDLNGWNYKAVIDVFYLYLIAIIFGASTGALIIIINKKITNRMKKRSKQIEKIPRGGDISDNGTDFSKEEFYQFLYDYMKKKVNSNTIDNASCFSKEGFFRVENTKTARKIFDSLKNSIKKKALPIVVTTGTAILAHKAANTNSMTLNLKIPFVSWPVSINTVLGSNLSLLALNLVRIATGTLDIVILCNLLSTLGLAWRDVQVLAIYYLKEKAGVLIFAAILNFMTLRFQKSYCDNFVTPVADTSMELVSLKPATTLLPDSSNGIYVQFLSSSSSLKLVLKDAPQCKLSIEDVLGKFTTSKLEEFEHYVKEQNEICKNHQIFEGEPLSLKDFDITIFKGNIDSTYWEILKREASNEEKKLNQMLPDVLGSRIEVVNDFPKPKKINKQASPSVVPQRDLNCESREFAKTFEGKVLEASDLIDQASTPTSIQTECLKNSRKSKSVPLKKRTKTLADLPDETSTIPEMFERKEGSRIQNKNQE